MRLMYRKIFNEEIVDIERVNLILTQAVKLSFSKESLRLKVVEHEAMVRRKRVTWLTGLSSDWEFEKRTLWRVDVARLPGVKRRTGVKRSGSGFGGKPGKSKRR